MIETIKNLQLYYIISYLMESIVCLPINILKVYIIHVYIMCIYVLISHHDKSPRLV